jgi:hypothetical protein
VNWINISARQVDPPNVVKPASSGLGLVIVKKILELHEYDFHVKMFDGIISFHIKMKTANPVFLTSV